MLKMHSQVMLKKRGSGTKYLAKVIAIGTECNLALLTVDDDEFWKGVSPVKLGPLPALQDAVTVVGYPIWGDTISVTTGFVTRVEMFSYSHGFTELLGLQIDAAINSGNYGRPAFNGKGDCVGIAFQSLEHEDEENIGYVVPTPVIQHFILEYEMYQHTSAGSVCHCFRFPTLGFEWQKMENPCLRKVMRMGTDQSGVLITRIEPTASEFKVLKPSDIILSFDGFDVANDGTVPFMNGDRIGFGYLVSQQDPGYIANVEVLRNSKIYNFHFKVATLQRLIQPHIYGLPPSYYIVAGFVFTTVSVPYLRSEYGKCYDEYGTPFAEHLHDMEKTTYEQPVVISQVLVADINIGYEDIVNTQVLAFNGKLVNNLRDLVFMVDECKDEYLNFKLELQQMVVLETKTAKEATLDILTKHCIPSAMSANLKT